VATGLYGLLLSSVQRSIRRVAAERMDSRVHHQGRASSGRSRGGAPRSQVAGLTHAPVLVLAMLAIRGRADMIRRLPVGHRGGVTPDELRAA